MKSQYRVKITGTGSFLPETIVTNDELTKTLDTTNEWIVQRTGIKTRHRAKPGASTAQFGAAAARKAIEMSGVAPEDIHFLFLATVTPDYRLPFSAGLIQRELGLPNAAGYDISSGCAGFVQGLQTASMFLKAGAGKHALIVGAEIMSSIVDPTDRSTAVIFGDGAGAVVLSRDEDEDADSDLLAITGGLKGNDEVLVITHGGSKNPVTHEAIDARSHYLFMKGRNVFRFAVDRFTTQIQECCEAAGIEPTDLDLIVPHQVNQRIVESAIRRLSVDMSKVMINLDRLGNTSGASVPIALNEVVRAGRVKRGQYVMFVAFGSGLAWAAALFKY